MKILLNIHHLRIGGSQLVAVRLAAALKERGHESVIYGPPGPLAELAASRGLRVIPQKPPNGRRPSRRAALALRDLSLEEGVDIVHASGHSVCMEAFFGPYLLDGTPLVCSIRGAEAVPRPYPKSIPLILAHQYVVEAAVRSGFEKVYLIRPPVDTETEHPGVDASDFLARHHLDNHRSNVVIVSRMAEKAKLEGLVRSIDAVEGVAQDLPVRLIVVGDGIAYDRVARRAERVNRRLGRQVVILTGQMLDPAPAYAAADVVLGMQGSILRGMAFQKPAIVLGEQGFSEIVTPESIDPFLRKAFYGIGDGDPSPRRLTDQLRTLLADGSLRDRLGRFSRRVVCEQVSLRAATDTLETIYGSAREKRPTSAGRFAEGIRLAASIAGGRASRVITGDTYKDRREAAWGRA
jgi:glycosyltransferase involved in cell wall biosynthesis